MATARQRMAIGVYGEQLAARYLVGQGLTLLDRNWRCPVGEIDLVLRDGDVLVCCEVKTRATAAFGDPLEAVGPEKFERLGRLAACWIEEHGLGSVEVRIDLVGVRLDAPPDQRVLHVEGVG